MIFSTKIDERYFVSRSDTDHPLSTYSKTGFELDGAEWPSVEHYYQGMKFEDDEVREAIRTAEHPSKAAKLAKSNKKRIRKNWTQVRQTMMTRAVYIKCRTHALVAKELLGTRNKEIVETSLYDYYWGVGRDGRGENTYGKVLMAVRDKLLEELGSKDGC